MQVASMSSAPTCWLTIGDTTRNPLQYSIGQQAQLLDRFPGEMGIADCPVGHGLGALLGFEFIKQFRAAWTHHGGQRRWAGGHRR
jgi:hypothetical protein